MTDQDDIKALRRDIAIRDGGLSLLYRIREALGFNRYFPLSHLDTRAKAIHDALVEMLETHGKPHREEWMNDAAFEHAKAVDFRARNAINHHSTAAVPPPGEIASQAMKAIEALRAPDASLAAVANTIRQAIADVIEAQKRKMDRYGLALMMIREGCEDPSGFAREVLSDE
jgi:hypothetical protein